MQVVSFLTERLQDADRAAADGRGLPAEQSGKLREVTQHLAGPVVGEERRHRDLQAILHEACDQRERRVDVPVLDLGDELGADPGALRDDLLREVSRLAEAAESSRDIARAAGCRCLPLLHCDASILSSEAGPPSTIVEVGRQLHHGWVSTPRVDSGPILAYLPAARRITTGGA